MAGEIKLEVYTFNIRQKREHEKEDIRKSLGVTENIQTFVNRFVAFNDKAHVDEVDQKSFEILTPFLTVNSGTSMFSGLVESGDYGTESSIKEKATMRTVFTKKKDHVDVKPFYFLIWLPKEKNIGFLMLQRTGIYGINTIFSFIFRSFVDSLGTNLSIDFSAYVSKNLAKAYLRGGVIKQIILKRNNLPADKSDRLISKDFVESQTNIEIKISTTKGGFKLRDQLKAFIDNSNAKFFSIPALEELGMDGQHLESVSVRMNGHSRTIDLSDTAEIKPYFTITDQIYKNPQTGHPTFESIDAVAKAYAEDIQKEDF